MKTNNSKTKAKAFLGAAFMLLIALIFTACPQKAKPKAEEPPVPPKHAITFSVESTTPNGTLKAKADGVPETSTSPINVEEGKTVTFTATASKGYSVKGWTLDGKPIAEAGTNTEYKLKVSKSATVKVSFEAIPKHAITFGVDSTTPNGTLTAKVDGGDITSGKEVEQGKTVTFTAEPSTNYKVKEWKVGDTVVTGNKTNTYTHTVTQATTVSVSFELSSVEGGAVLILSPDKLTIKVKAKTADGSAITVEGCNETTLANDTETKLTAKGTKVILKGNITELHCSDNKLTSLNVQGLTALQKLSCGGNKLTALNVQGLKFLKDLNCSSNKLTELNVQGCTALEYLWCSGNQLNAKAMTELLNALPARTAGDDAEAILYFEWTSFTEGNCKDFTNPPELKAAFDGAKKKNWKLQKMNANGDWVDI